MKEEVNNKQILMRKEDICFWNKVDIKLNLSNID